MSSLIFIYVCSSWHLLKSPRCQWVLRTERLQREAGLLFAPENCLRRCPSRCCPLTVGTDWHYAHPSSSSSSLSLPSWSYSLHHWGEKHIHSQRHAHCCDAKRTDRVRAETSVCSLLNLLGKYRAATSGSSSVMSSRYMPSAPRCWLLFSDDIQLQKMQFETFIIANPSGFFDTELRWYLSSWMVNQLFR